MQYRIEPPANDGIMARNILAEDGSVVATVNHYRDAPLIASAPALYEALRELHSTCRQLLLIAQNNSTMIRAKQALAKAEK